MSVIVLDANVAGKWCLPGSSEPHSREAFQLLRRYLANEVEFVVPDLFWAELGNLLWNAARRGRCSRAEAAQALQTITGRNFPTVPALTLITHAASIAAFHDRTVYDSLYVALAVHARGVLVTADERLANSLAAHFPVKWLGAM